MVFAEMCVCEAAGIRMCSLSLSLLLPRCLSLWLSLSLALPSTLPLCLSLSLPLPLSLSLCLYVCVLAYVRMYVCILCALIFVICNCINYAEKEAGAAG